MSSQICPRASVSSCKVGWTQRFYQVWGPSNGKLLYPPGAACIKRNPGRPIRPCCRQHGVLLGFFRRLPRELREDLPSSLKSTGRPQEVWLGRHSHQWHSGGLGQCSTRFSLQKAVEMASTCKTSPRLTTPLLLTWADYQRCYWIHALHLIKRLFLYFFLKCLRLHTQIYTFEAVSHPECSGYLLATNTFQNTLFSSKLNFLKEQCDDKKNVTQIADLTCRSSHVTGLFTEWPASVWSSAPPVCDNSPVCHGLCYKPENKQHVGHTEDLKAERTEARRTHAAVGLRLVQGLQQLIDGGVREPDGGGSGRQRSLKRVRHTSVSSII